MTWIPPGHWIEQQLQLKKSGQVKLDANGNGTLFFTPDNARQRWVVTSVVVKTNQPATSTVTPVATIALNSNDIATMSDGNNRGASWSGNQDTFSGNTDVGPCDNLSVIFSPPSGQSPAALVGVIASAVITGSKFTRRR
jgi:hypothetical protein